MRKSKRVNAKLTFEEEENMRPENDPFLPQRKKNMRRVSVERVRRGGVKKLGGFDDGRSRERFKQPEKFLAKALSFGWQKGLGGEGKLWVPSSITTTTPLPAGKPCVPA